MMSKFITRILDKAYTVFQERQVDICFERSMVSFTFDDFPSDALNTGGSILEDAGWAKSDGTRHLPAPPA